MDRRSRRVRRPTLEGIEPRALLSGITSVLAASADAAHGAASAAFVPSTTSVALPTNQGPQGTNLALTPTGTLTPQELKREQFTATFVATYVIGPGETSTEAKVIAIRGAGSSNAFNHGDIQMKIVVPIDPSTPIGGVSATFDRNINSNSVLGLDLTAPQSNVDADGRPNQLSPSIDPNISSGVFDEGYSQGVVSIKYLPSGKRAPGAIEQGKAIVKIRAQIYTLGVDFILANSDINPGGTSQNGPNHHKI